MDTEESRSHTAEPNLAGDGRTHATLRTGFGIRRSSGAAMEYWDGPQEVHARVKATP